MSSPGSERLIYPKTSPFFGSSKTTASVIAFDVPSMSFFARTDTEFIPVISTPGNEKYALRVRFLTTPPSVLTRYLSVILSGVSLMSSFALTETAVPSTSTATSNNTKIFRIYCSLLIYFHFHYKSVTALFQYKISVFYIIILSFFKLTPPRP